MYCPGQEVLPLDLGARGSRLALGADPINEPRSKSRGPQPELHRTGPTTRWRPTPPRSAPPSTPSPRWRPRPRRRSPRPRRYADHLDAIAAEQTARTEAAEALAARTAALRTRFGNTEATRRRPNAEDEEPDDDEDDREPRSTRASSATEVPLRTRRQGPLRCGRAVPQGHPPGQARPHPRPDHHHRRRRRARVRHRLPAGATWSRSARPLINRMRGFGTPSGDGSRENLQHYGVASFRLDFPKELTIDRHSDDMEVLDLRRQGVPAPRRLAGRRRWLVCPVARRIYDLCAGETAEGILSLPEVNVARGGIKYTSGPDFSDDLRRRRLLPDRGAGHRRHHQDLLRGALPAVHRGPPRRLRHLHQGPDPHQRGLPGTGPAVT